jgi:hypothetical protein
MYAIRFALKVSFSTITWLERGLGSDERDVEETEWQLKKMQGCYGNQIPAVEKGNSSTMPSALSKCMARPQAHRKLVRRSEL